MSQPTPHTMHTDGGARGNPGPAGAGVVIHNAAGELVESHSRYLGTRTNNQAEYDALILGSERLRALGVKHAKILMDSELIVRQMQGRYKVKNAQLKPLYDQVKALLEGLDVVFEHVRREYNKEADALVNQAIDAQG